MNEPWAMVWVSLIGSLTTIITVVISHLKQNKKADQVAEKVVQAADVIKEKDAETSKQIGVVHAMVNSQLATVTNSRDVAEARVRELELRIASMNKNGVKGNGTELRGG